MAITHQVITALNRDGTDMLGTKNLAIKIADESIVSGSLLTRCCRAFDRSAVVLHAAVVAVTNSRPT